MAKLSAVAHANNLAIGQKNSADIASQKALMGTDFVMSE